MKRVLFAMAGLTSLALIGGVSVQACGSSDTTGQTAATTGGAGGIGDIGFLEDGGLADGAACVTETKKAEKVPLDMVIGLDTSFSMDFDDKWTNVRAALKSFVSNPAYADLGIGLQFFPIRKQCSIADYQKPAVELALQPKVKDAIAAALDAQQMDGGTPMVPLLEGLTAYLQTKAVPGRKPVIVLATDGIPDDTCLTAPPNGLANTLDNAVAVADKAFTGTPSISVFVIGVGSELDALNAIAKGGGTGTAALVDSTKDAQKAFLDALDSIRKQAIPCDYAIPSGTEVDPTKMNVTYTPATGSTETFLFVGNEAGCAKAPTDGWYFDDPAQPTKVILCEQVCDAVKVDDRGHIDVVFGCPRLDVN